MAGQMVAVCLRARTATGRNTVALSGGCYQNTLLLRLTVEGLRAQGFAVLTHSLVPPNDGGIALGQAVFAMAAQQ
jgi:hydrogenase maturation protein HypF